MSILELEQRLQREVPRLRAVRRARHEPRHFLDGVAGLAGELAVAGLQREAREGPRGGAGGRGSGLVEEVPPVHEKRLVSVSREREARAVHPSESRAHRGDRGGGFASPHAGAALVVRLVEIEKRVREEGLVLEERGDLRDAVLPRALKRPSASRQSSSRKRAPRAPRRGIAARSGCGRRSRGPRRRARSSPRRACRRGREGRGARAPREARRARARAVLRTRKGIFLER